MSDSNGDAGQASSPPLKYHSERSRTRSNSKNEHTQQQQTNLNNSSSASSSSSAPPQLSPSPPPTQSCSHIGGVDLTLLRQRLRSRTFQKSFTSEQLECADCAVHYPNSHLWVCLHCNKIEASRCGRFHQKHALAHFKEAGHSLAMHLSTRVIWCYSCDSEVVDDYSSGPHGVTPQLVRSALDKEDVAPEVEDDAPIVDTTSDEPEEDAFRPFYTNADGGQTGLANLGNTCFFNAGLQALLHCPPLIAFFAAPPPSRDAERRANAMLDCKTAEHTRNQQARLRLLADFGILIQKVWSGRYGLCVPTDVLKDVLILNPMFRGYGQHDAQELIRSMVDFMHEGNKLKVEYEYDLRRKLKHAAEEEARQQAEREKEEQEQAAKAKAARIKRNTSSSVASDDSTMADDDSPKKKVSPPAKPRFPDCSIVSDLFQGTLESRVTCKACGAVSLTKDPFYDLSLEIPRESQLKRISAERGEEALTPQAKTGFFGSIGNLLGLTSPTLSLETCLHSFVTSDSLMAKDQYRCDKCKEKVDASKTLSLGTSDTLPEILTLHIKRFSHNSFFGTKIGRHVTFPLKGLDLEPYLTQTNHQQQQHTTNNKKNTSTKPKKSVNGGHYIAYCKSHVTGKWYEFDDKIVTEMSEEKISKIEAYMLFYQRTHTIKPYERIMKQIQACTITNLASINNNSTTTPPTTPVRYISKYWLKKMEIFGRPEPIDNRDLCCSHGLPKPLPYDGGDRAIGITPAGWESLFAEYGGGPIVDSHLGQACEVCQLPLLRAAERQRITEADAIASKQSEDDPFFLIHAEWLQQWRSFVSQNGPRPGPITNHRLMRDDDPNQILPGLQRGTDYRSLHGLVWQELWKLYGGGPVIERPTSDIYIRTKPKSPDTPMDADEEEEGEEDGDTDGDSGDLDVDGEIEVDGPPASTTPMSVATDPNVAP